MHTLDTLRFLWTKKEFLEKCNFGFSTKQLSNLKCFY